MRIEVAEKELDQTRLRAAKDVKIGKMNYLQHELQSETFQLQQRQDAMRKACEEMSLAFTKVLSTQNPELHIEGWMDSEQAMNHHQVKGFVDSILRLHFKYCNYSDPTDLTSILNPSPSIEAQNPIITPKDVLNHTLNASDHYEHMEASLEGRIRHNRAAHNQQHRKMVMENTQLVEELNSLRMELEKKKQRVNAMEEFAKGGRGRRTTVWDTQANPAIPARPRKADDRRSRSLADEKRRSTISPSFPVIS